MLVPLAPLALRAVLWYQGESNLGDPSDYLRLQAGVVSEIRRLWARADLPFLVVQLPLFGPPSPVPDPDDPWVRVRQAQGRATDLGFTEVVPALDLGESYDIHPARKREVGLRLALAARKLVLGEGLDVWTGPRYQGSVRVDGGVRLRFDQTGTGLTTRGRTVTGFFVAGPGTGFSPAPAHLWGDAVRVDLPPGPGPWQVCYAWAAHPEEADLVNSEGLPMFPFQAWV
jgi:sialate O-acetylesterase